MTALGIGTFSIKDPLFSPIIAIFATACSYFWFRTNLGSKFWQESWEVEVTELSKELGVRSFERPLGGVVEQVRASLAKGQASEKRSFLRTWIDGLTVRKYSVTYNMILLSLFSTIFWALVALALIVRSVTVGEAPLVTTSKGVATHQAEIGHSPSSKPGRRSNAARQVTNQVSSTHPKTEASESPH